MTTKQCFRNNKFKLEVRERDHGPASAAGSTSASTWPRWKRWADWPRGLRDEVVAWVAVHRDELMEELKRWHP